MTDPFVFDTTSPRYGLPLLFPGQSQKEVFVNEAHALTDAMLHCAVEGESSSPPATPVEGENWIVGTAADGEWSGQDGDIACRQAGNWIFVSPRSGMRVFDRASGQIILFETSWARPAAPGLPTGGTTIDAEARMAISELIDALRACGVLPAA